MQEQTFSITTSISTDHRFHIPRISSIAILRVVESSSSSVITLEPAKSAIKMAFLNWCPSATFGDGICTCKDIPQSRYEIKDLIELNKKLDKMLIWHAGGPIKREKAISLSTQSSMLCKRHDKTGKK